MKYLSFLFVTIVAVAALLLAGCDTNSVTQQDNTPPPISQVPGTAATQAAADSNLIPHQYIVIYKSRWKGLVKKAKAQQALQFVNARISELGLSDKAIKHRYQYALRGFNAKLTDQQLRILKKDPRVDYIEQDRKFKAFSAGKSSMDIRTTVTSTSASSSGQTTPWGIQRVGGPFDGTGKKAWIIGGGIDPNGLLRSRNPFTMTISILKASYLILWR